MPSTTAITGGETLYYSSPAGGWRRGVIRERVTGVGSSGVLELVQQLPANSRIVHATLNNRNAITPRLASSAAQTTAGQAGVSLVLATALTSIAGIAGSAANSTSNILVGMIQTAAAASVSANSKASGLASAAATAGGFLDASLRSVTTVAQKVFVLPYISTTAATLANAGFNVNTTATSGTSQCTLNGTGTATSGTTTADFDVQIVFDVFDPTPDA